MKIVVNRCVGRFNLSDAAVEECRKRGLYLTQFDDHGDYESAAQFRSNPTLVEVIELLGSGAASGLCSALDVIDVPFGPNIGWKIHSDQGVESVVPVTAE